MTSLRNIAVSVIFAVSVFLCAGALAFNPSMNGDGTFMSWDPSAMPISYRIHLENPASPENAARVRSVIRAFEAWERVSNSLVSFRYAGLTEQDTPAFDGVNIITWVQTGWRYEPDSIAYTTLWVTGDGRILDADIELNDEYFDWSATGRNGVMDIQNALTHEVGHFIGIGHTVDEIGASMFPIIPDGEVRKRLVKADDLEAAAYLYPVTAAELAVYELAVSELVDGFSFAEKTATNYESISPEGRIMLISGMRITADGESGLGAVFVENGQEVFYIYPGPGVAGEELTATSRDAWEIPGGILKDLTTVDIDGDGADEIAVLRMDHMADHALYVYDRPPDGEFERRESRVWIARDLWRIPGRSDSITVFSLDLDGNGRREVATLTYSVEGVYVINAFSTPRRFDSSREDAMSLPGAIVIPFTIDGSILDLDSIDSDGDGVSEAAALVKSDAGYSVQILPLALPEFPEEVQKLEPTATMQLILDEGEYPLSLTVLEGTDLEGPRILVVLGTSDR